MIYTWENYYRDYYYSHQKECRDYMRNYLNKNRTSIIYKIIYNDEIKYYGSTDSRFRLNFHYTSNSKLDLKNNPGTIYYSEINNVNRLELYFIEYYLINRYNPPENTYKKDLNEFDFSEDKKKELINIADNLCYNIF